jgi:hypothetical protein
LLSEELHNLYTSPNIIKVTKSRRIRCMGHVAYMVDMGNIYIILFGKPEGKRPLGRPRHKWEVGSEGNKVGGCGLDLSVSGQGLVVGSCEQ